MSEISNFPSWLHTVTRNYCLMRIRNRKEILVKETDQSKSKKLMESDEDLHQKIEKEAQFNKIEKAITTLVEFEK